MNSVAKIAPSWHFQNVARSTNVGRDKFVVRPDISWISYFFSCTLYLLFFSSFTTYMENSKFTYDKGARVKEILIGLCQTATIGGAVFRCSYGLSSPNEDGSTITSKDGGYNDWSAYRLFERLQVIFVRRVIRCHGNFCCGRQNMKEVWWHVGTGINGHMVRVHFFSRPGMCLHDRRFHSRLPRNRRRTGGNQYTA